MPGKQQLTLALASFIDGIATFDVTYEGKAPTPKHDGRWSLWLSLDTESDGNPDTFAPINGWGAWGTPEGSKTQVSIQAAGTAQHRAFVTEFPDVWSAVSNVVEF